MRTLHELYKMLWENIKDKDYIIGLCSETIGLYGYNKITHDEYYFLKSHFESQKPTANMHSEFLQSNAWLGNDYWWSDKENRNPVNRKLFIQKMIEITKP